MTDIVVVGDVFTVTYTRGDTLATETSDLNVLDVREHPAWCRYGCLLLTFARPGGSSSDGTVPLVIEALTGCARHPAQCTPTQKGTPS